VGFYIYYIMKYIITESQYKLIMELSPNSSGVQDFLDMVKSTPGMLKHLGFKSFKSLEEYILDGSIEDLYELKSDAKKFDKKK